MRLAPLVLVLVTVTQVSASPTLSSGCPDRCVCDEQLVVQCAGQHLSAFPMDLPLGTRQLIISNNRLAELPALALNYLSDLVYLDVSNNSLTEVSASTFGNLRVLVYLDLSFNALTRIEARAFGPLVALVMLRMTDNPRLADIHADAFTDNAALQVLDVSRNNLTRVHVRVLAALPALRSVGLSGNPWSCACANLDLSLWVHVEAFKFQDEGQTVCGSPADLRGRRLGDVGYDLPRSCYRTLGPLDYAFFVAVGFVIFAGGIVSSWATGVVMVIYQRHVRRKEEHADDEPNPSPSPSPSPNPSPDLNPHHGNGGLKTPHTVKCV